MSQTILLFLGPQLEHYIVYFMGLFIIYPTFVIAKLLGICGIFIIIIITQTAVTFASMFTLVILDLEGICIKLSLKILQCGYHYCVLFAL